MVKVGRYVTLTHSLTQRSIRDSALNKRITPVSERERERGAGGDD